MKIFNYDIQTKEYYCQLNNHSLKKVPSPTINVYVRLQNVCNAKCKFCEFKGNYIPFNEKGFREVLKEIRSKVKINRLSFTGGEPTLDFELFKRCLKFVQDFDSDIFTVVNTNGLHLNKLEELGLNSIALSRHHYNQDKNDEIFGIKTSNIKNIKNLHLSCNLIKGYIDNEEEILKYLDWCDMNGFTDIGFVALMKVNDYCKEHFISQDIFNFNGKRFLKVKEYHNKDIHNELCCKCCNYLYGGDNLVNIYSRHYIKSDNNNVLVYDLNKLKDGFNGKVIKEW